MANPSSRISAPREDDAPTLQETTSFTELRPRLGDNVGVVDQHRLHWRDHPCCNTSAGEHADYENSRSRNDARWPNGQQFGPPQAIRTGSLCTDATIATPVPIASASKTKIAAVIFMVPPPKCMITMTGCGDRLLSNRSHGLVAQRLHRNAQQCGCASDGGEREQQKQRELHWIRPLIRTFVRDRRFPTFWGLLGAG
jgi:hypothetical protein